VRLEGGAAHGIRDRIDLIPFSQGVERREGEAGFRPQRGHQQLLAAGCLDGVDELGVFPALIDVRSP
jgi:hypothetical protein